MKLRPIHALVLWPLALVSVLTGAHERLWNVLRACGLGDHPLGAFFVLFPLGVLAAEWLLLVGLPPFALALFARKMRPGA